MTLFCPFVWSLRNKTKRPPARKGLKAIVSFGRCEIKQNDHQPERVNFQNHILFKDVMIIEQLLKDVLASIPPDQSIIISSHYDDGMTMFRGCCSDCYRSRYYKTHSNTPVLSLIARKSYVIIYV